MSNIIIASKNLFTEISSLNARNKIFDECRSLYEEILIPEQDLTLRDKQTAVEIGIGIH